MNYKLIYTNSYIRRVTKFLKKHPELISQYEKTVETQNQTIKNLKNERTSLTSQVSKLSMTVKSDEERIDFFDTNYDPSRLLKTITRRKSETVNTNDTTVIADVTETTLDTSV